MQDAEVIQSLLRGDEHALGIAYDRYAGELLSFVLAWTKSREDAEEIVQDTFLRLWNSHTAIRGRDSLRPLLFTIARNAVIDRLRQRINSIAYEEYVAQRDTALSTGGSIPDYDTFEQTLRKAVATLPAAQRTIVWLSDIKGLSNRAIAAQLGISEKTVRNQLSLGNKRLEELLRRLLGFLGFILTI